MTNEEMMHYLRTHYSRLDLEGISQKINVDESILRRAIMQENDARGHPVTIPPNARPYLIRIIELMQEEDLKS